MCVSVGLQCERTVCVSVGLECEGTVYVSVGLEWEAALVAGSRFTAQVIFNKLTTVETQSSPTTLRNFKERRAWRPCYGSL